jgi:hypothetical protein
VAKLKTLNQIVAIEKTVKQRTYSAVDALYKAVQKPEAFTGYSKTYQPKNDADDVLPPESKVCERIAKDVLTEIAKQQTELFDVVATKDKGNTVARADVVLDDGAGTVLLTNVPATTLLFLEKQLTDMRTIYGAIPTLDAIEDWTYDPNSRLHRAEVVQTTRTRKVEIPLLIVPATVEHPAQAKTITEDKIVGIWSKRSLSGLLPRPEKEALLARIDALIKAVKQARERANMQEVEAVHVGAVLFGYLNGS